MRGWMNWVLVTLGALLAISGAFAFTYQYVEPAPPKHIVMTTGSDKGAYHAFGQRYAAILAKAGITLELKPSAGTLENIERLKDDAAGVQVGLLQGGLASADSNPELSSLGRMFLEPLWVFHRSDLKIERLSDLAGRRLSVGPEGSGTRPLVTTLLGASSITSANATFLGATASDSAQLLIDGTADAIFFTMAADGELVGRLLREPKVKLLSFDQAEAYTRRYPFLAKITLPAGVVDLGLNIPSHDITLLAPAATLVVRKDLHPALIGLLVSAAKTVHAGPGMFQKPDEFPQAIDTELPLDPEAVRFYKNGPPFLQRFMPFWLATLIERMRILIIPLATVLLPLSRILPIAYRWQIKRRMLRWYNELKQLEHRVKSDKSPDKVPGYLSEILRIEDHVRGMKIPLAFSDQLYDLRNAVNLVRQRIEAMKPT